MQLVTLCTDTPEQILRGQKRHGAQAVMLSDPDLEVVDRFNLRNQFNLTPKGLKPMPIPTTLLVDKDGIVRWIDQAEDYQVRSHPDRVLSALREHLD